MSDSTLFRVSGFSKRYGRVHALRDVSFGVRRGEVLGLIGPNGSGKTTLFECLGGTLPRDRGEVRRAGVPLREDERRGLVFYMPDGITPWPSQRLRWVLDFAHGFFGGRPWRDGLADRLGLTPLLDARLAELSKGERKRALLAVALMAPQPVLLADEPFDGLDLRQTRDVACLLREEAASGRTVFLSIHQIGDAARVCDRFVLLSAGRVCAEGSLQELLRAAQADIGADAGLEDVFLALT